MPSYVIKRGPDVDEYLYYSTVVDHPVTYPGTREEMKDWLLHNDGGANHDAEDRLARADANGSSAMFPQLGPACFGGWDTDGFVMRECDNLPPDAYLTRDEMFEHMKQDAVLAGVNSEGRSGG